MIFGDIGGGKWRFRIGAKRLTGLYASWRSARAALARSSGKPCAPARDAAPVIDAWARSRPAIDSFRKRVWRRARPFSTRCPAIAETSLRRASLTPIGLRLHNSPANLPSRSRRGFRVAPSGPHHYGAPRKKPQGSKGTFRGLHRRHPRPRKALRDHRGDAESARPEGAGARRSFRFRWASRISTRPTTSRKAAIAAIERGETKYPPVLGIQPLRERSRRVQARERPRLQGEPDDRRNAGRMPSTGGYLVSRARSPRSPPS